jgi:predicted GH43/DUF377 family glycosyl hydrolase
MTSTPIAPAVIRTAERLTPDPSRVLARLYLPGEDPSAPETRVTRLLREIQRMSDEQIEQLLEEIRADFSDRHRDLEAVLERNFAAVASQLDPGDEPAPPRRLVMGAYVTAEYALEAAALFNPSMVPHPDQSGLGPGEARFVLSLRAVGEGHLSSIEFREGVIGPDGIPTPDPITPWVQTGRRRSAVYDKHLFAYKLGELGAMNEVAEHVIDPLPNPFTSEDLDVALATLEDSTWPEAIWRETSHRIHWLAASNYVVEFPGDIPLSERVLFPEGPNESAGMEDARFVQFTEDDGTLRYYATYTAFDGIQILPQLIETTDFRSFHIVTLNGESAANKGMALFPRKIKGQYVALSRFDRQNLYVMHSDHVRFWDDRQRIRVPTQPWELFQIGNCGSPIETEAGWVVLTHGVGPMRRYCMGVMLLDLEDPAKVLAELPEPILEPEEDERDGYVPNVVYSCGAMVHDQWLVTPYGYSDAGARFAVMNLDNLVARLLEHPLPD